MQRMCEQWMKGAVAVCPGAKTQTQKTHLVVTQQLDKFFLELRPRIGLTVDAGLSSGCGCTTPLIFDFDRCSTKVALFQREQRIVAY